jgi:hypothetical protein
MKCGKPTNARDPNGRPICLACFRLENPGADFLDCGGFYVDANRPCRGTSVVVFPLSQ